MKSYGRDPVNEAQWVSLDQIGHPWVQSEPTDWLLAIDDTDNLTSRGTGFLSRQLAVRLAENGIAFVKGITRHQLLVDPRIPYTSHNSSACLVLTTGLVPKDVFEFTCDYLLKESAEGSDAGTVIIQRGTVTENVKAFGHAAKVSVLTKQTAIDLAAHHAIPMAGLTGTGGGVIGALAAVGLNADGNDGRFLWIKKLRSMAGQHCTVDQLQQSLGVTLQDIHNKSSIHFENPDLVELGEWPRAVYIDQRPTLLVEKKHEPNFSGWRTASKDYVCQY